MASGVSGTGWSDLVKKLNIFFQDQKRKDFAKQFKTKHGPKGDGDNSGKRPYKFGQYVDQFIDPQDGALLPGDNERAQFLIDSGIRHWDATSLRNLEDAIKQSLTREDAAGMPAPTQIVFKLSPADPGATKATANITSVAASGSSAANSGPLNSSEEITKAISSGSTLMIEIKCPPANLRPRPQGP